MVCALLPPPLHMWALLGWLILAFALCPVRVWRWQFHLLWATALFSFLAALIPFAHTATWTKALAGVGIALPSTLSVQPWVTLEACLVLCTGLLAAVWYLGQAYPNDFLKKFLRRLLILLGLLCAVATVALSAQLKNPAFPTADVFTFFANRNQSATLYALTALVAGGLFLIEQRRVWRTIAIAALAFALGALALGPSRGGWLGLGVGAVVMLWGRPRAALMGAGLAAAGAIIILIGIPGWEGRQANLAEVRPFFFADAWRMILENPMGIGAGNFQYIFPQYQSVPLGDKIVLHPENDWLWMLGELGAAALLLPVAFFSLRWAPHRRGRIIAALLAALLVTSLFDVPLHRLGLIVLLCACVGPVLSSQDTRSFGKLSRTLALLPLALLATGFGFVQKSNNLHQRFEASLEIQNLALTRTLGQKIIQNKPLDMRTYQTLGQAELGWRGSASAAARYFEKSFALQPKLATLPYEAGLAWQPIDTAKAMSAWREALRRTPQKSVVFAKILRNGGLPARSYAPLCAGQPQLWAQLLLEERPERLGVLLPEVKTDFWQLPQAPLIAQRALLSTHPPLNFFARDPRTPRRFRALILSLKSEYQAAAMLAQAEVPPTPLADPFAQLANDELTLKARLRSSQAPEYLEALAARAQKRADEPALLRTLDELCRLPNASAGARALYAQKLARQSKWLESWQQLRLILFPQDTP